MSGIYGSKQTKSVGVAQGQGCLLSHKSLATFLKSWYVLHDWPLVEKSTCTCTSVYAMVYPGEKAICSSLQHTNSDGLHGNTAAPITVGSHDTDGVYHIVGYSDWNTCFTGGDWTETWTDSDGVVDWSPTIILWGLPLHCEGHTVLTISLNIVGESLGRRGETWGEGFQCTHAPYKTEMTNNYSTFKSKSLTHVLNVKH